LACTGSLSEIQMGSDKVIFDCQEGAQAYIWLEMEETLPELVPFDTLFGSGLNITTVQPFSIVFGERLGSPLTLHLFDSEWEEVIDAPQNNPGTYLFVESP
jgi:hypothetical protein